MGGNRTVGQMKKICEPKGAAVCGAEIVNWSNPSREKRITEVLENWVNFYDKSLLGENTPGAMDPYKPIIHYLDKEEFEKLGCPPFYIIIC